MKSNIKYRVGNQKVQIYGTNKMDYYWASVFVIVLGFIVVLTLSNFIIWNVLVFIVLLAFVVLYALKYIINFSIIITPKNLVIKKTIFFIPYLVIKQHFNKVLLDIKVSTLYFECNQNKVVIENFEGFEVDCLLVTSNKKYYEFGDKNDADLIFNYIVNGLDDLNVKKINL